MKFSTAITSVAVLLPLFAESASAAVVDRAGNSRFGGFGKGGAAKGANNAAGKAANNAAGKAGAAAGNKGSTTTAAAAAASAAAASTAAAAAASGKGANNAASGDPQTSLSELSFLSLCSLRSDDLNAFESVSSAPQLGYRDWICLQWPGNAYCWPIGFVDIDEQLYQLLRNYQAAHHKRPAGQDWLV